MRIVVLGSTGRTGRALVAQALERGHEVTALIHNGSPEAVAPLAERAGLRFVYGDVLERDGLRGVLSGHDGVVSALGSHRRARPVRLYSAGMRNTLEAMRKQGVARLVCLSAAGVGGSYAQLPPVFRYAIIPLYAGEVYADMARMEHEVATSDLEWTIVRPIWLRDSEPVGCVALCQGGVPKGRPGISRSDVAAFMLDAVETGRWSGEKIGIARPTRQAEAEC